MSMRRTPEEIRRDDLRDAQLAAMFASELKSQGTPSGIAACLTRGLCRKVKRGKGHVYTLTAKGRRAQRRWPRPRPTLDDGGPSLKEPHRYEESKMSGGCRHCGQAQHAGIHDSARRSEPGINPCGERSRVVTVDYSQLEARIMADAAKGSTVAIDAKLAPDGILVQMWLARKEGLEASYIAALHERGLLNANGFSNDLTRKGAWALWERATESIREEIRATTPEEVCWMCGTTTRDAVPADGTKYECRDRAACVARARKYVGLSANVNRGWYNAKPTEAGTYLIYCAGWKIHTRLVELYDRDGIATLRPSKESLSFVHPQMNTRWAEWNECTLDGFNSLKKRDVRWLKVEFPS